MTDLLHISTGPESGEMVSLPMNYKGYIIEAEGEPWAKIYGGPIKYYPEDGVDITWNGQSNVHNARTLKEAKDEIDELTSNQ